MESCLPNQSVFALPGVVQYHDSCVPSPCKYILSFKRMLLKNNRKNKPPWGRTVSTALGISKAAHPPKKKKHQLQKNLEKSHESNIDLNFSQIEPPSDLEKSWVFDLQRSHLQRHQGFCLNVLPRYEGYAVLGESTPT